MDTIFIPVSLSGTHEDRFLSTRKGKGALQALEDLVSGQDTVALESGVYYMDDYADDEDEHMQVRFEHQAVLK